MADKTMDPAKWIAAIRRRRKLRPVYSDADGEDFRKGVPGLYVDVQHNSPFEKPVGELYVRLDSCSAEKASAVLGYMHELLGRSTHNTGRPYVDSPEPDRYIIREDIAGYAAAAAPPFRYEGSLKMFRKHEALHTVFYVLMKKCVRMTPGGEHVKLRIIREKEPSNGESKVVPSGRKAR